MKYLLSKCLLAGMLLGIVAGCGGLYYREASVTPLQFLKSQEAEHRGSRGEVYLGNVMTLYYPSTGVKADARVYPLLLELTDVLKTPLRQNYRLVLKGFSDSRGPAELRLRLSRERAETLKDLLVKKYYMKKERIITDAYGDAHPAASNETMEGRARNRRVEIHVYGDVSEAVRFMGAEEEKR